MGSRDLIIAETSRLRRYARALTGSMDAADDLVQETLERALEKLLFLEKRARDLRPRLFSTMNSTFRLSAANVVFAACNVSETLQSTLSRY